MSSLLLSLFLSIAGASEPGLTQELTWELAVDGRPVGTRELTIRYLPSDDGLRRILEATTRIDTASAGVPFRFEQRLTAHAGSAPASFHSVVSENGTPREVQGRPSPWGWTLSVVERGRDRSWELDPSEVDLSTADLLDPDTRVPLSQRETARLLMAETGEVLTGRVSTLGASELSIDGTAVPVQGIAWEGSTGRSEFFYTSDGVLVRYETDVLGRRVQATLTEPPPPGVDDAPVRKGGAGIEEIAL